MFCQILRHNLRGFNVEYLNLNNFIVKAYVRLCIYMMTGILSMK